MLKLKHALIAALAIPALALAAACDDDAEGDSNASQEAIDTTNARVQRNEMLWSTLAIQQQPLHDIDAAMNGDGEIPTNAIPTMRTVARVVYVTNWDDTLKADAEQLRTEALAVIEALEADDRDTAGEHTSTLHEASHDFVDDAWDHLAPEAAPAEEHEEESETPAAGATEEGDDHDEEGETPEAEATP